MGNVDKRYEKYLQPVLTEEDKSSLQNFVNAVKNLDHDKLISLSVGLGDNLSSEMIDIVSFELKRRELEILKSKGIDPQEDFSYKHREHVEYDETLPNGGSLKLMERHLIGGLSLEKLEKAKENMKEQYIPINKDDLHSWGKGGVNYYTDKYLVEDNGKQIKINNRAIRERFRRKYLEELSAATGIDYTKYDNSGPSYDGDNLDFSSVEQKEKKARQDISDYEED